MSQGLCTQSAPINCFFSAFLVFSLVVELGGEVGIGSLAYGGRPLRVRRWLGRRSPVGNIAIALLLRRTGPPIPIPSRPPESSLASAYGIAVSRRRCGSLPPSRLPNVGPGPRRYRQDRLPAAASSQAWAYMALGVIHGTLDGVSASKEEG